MNNKKAYFFFFKLKGKGFGCDFSLETIEINSKSYHITDKSENSS